MRQITIINDLLLQHIYNEMQNSAKTTGMMAKKHKNERILVDKVTGRPLMTIELFLKMMLRYGILTGPEAMTAYNTGILPDDVLQRLKLVDNANKN